MRALLIDTATENCSAAYVDSNNCIEEINNEPRKHANVALDMVSAIFKKAGLNNPIQQLDCLVLSAGPGSFTGLRIGCSLVQGLAFGWEKQVICISTLQIMAQKAYSLYGLDSLIVALDARMGELYWGCYKLNESQKIMQPIINDQVSSPNIIREFLAINTISGAVGVGFAAYPEIITNSSFPIYSELFAQASYAYEPAKTKWLKREIQNPCDIQPFYCRNKVTNVSR